MLQNSGSKAGTPLFHLPVVWPFCHLPNTSLEKEQKKEEEKTTTTTTRVHQSWRPRVNPSQTDCFIWDTFHDPRQGKDSFMMRHEFANRAPLRTSALSEPLTAKGKLHLPIFRGQETLARRRIQSTRIFTGQVGHHNSQVRFEANSKL